jgi:hypothetical protein
VHAFTRAFCVALGPLRLNLVAFVVALSCMPYLLMNTATHARCLPTCKADQAQSPSQLCCAPPRSYRAQHTHIAVGGLEYLISLMSSRLE